MRKLPVLFILLITNYIYAANLKDLTGTYKCNGSDGKDRDFKASHTLVLDKKNSNNKIAGYTFDIMGYQGNGGYRGFAVFDGKSMAIYFSNPDRSKEDTKNDYGITIAQLTKNGFKKVYYQPTYKGGNIGWVNCQKISNKIITSN